MAFFKFRKNADEQHPPAAAAESVEALRKRARHRLIGAAVLVLLGVIGFPLLFDSQPRPIAVDIPIDIPDKNKAKPLGNLPVAAPNAQTSGAIETESASAPVASAPVAAAASVAASAKPAAAAPAASKPAPAATASSPVSSASAAAKPEPKAPAKPAASDPKPAEASKAQALLDGKEPDKKPAASGGRFVVQVGAFADATKARDARAKLERAGLKTYTQDVETKDGRRTRVRVGPFEAKAEALKAAEKIRKLDLNAAILEL
ncbi:MAG: SPOR domain-containing protein [Burkholderiales bacterium]